MDLTHNFEVSDHFADPKVVVEYSVGGLEFNSGFSSQGSEDFLADQLDFSSQIYEELDDDEDDLVDIETVDSHISMADQIKSQGITLPSSSVQIDALPPPGPLENFMADEDPPPSVGVLFSEGQYGLFDLPIEKKAGPERSPYKLKPEADYHEPLPTSFELGGINADDMNSLLEQFEQETVANSDDTITTVDGKMPEPTQLASPTAAVSIDCETSPPRITLPSTPDHDYVRTTTQMQSTIVRPAVSLLRNSVRNEKTHSQDGADLHTVINKIPGYMAELSAPVVIDDSPAILPSKLLGETTRSNRDPTPDREDAEPQLSKLPAYHSEFTYSQRYHSPESSDRYHYKRRSRSHGKCKHRRRRDRSSSSSGSSSDRSDYSSEEIHTQRSRSRRKRSYKSSLSSRSRSSSRSQRSCSSDSSRERCWKRRSRSQRRDGDHISNLPNSYSRRSAEKLSAAEEKERAHNKAMAERRVVYVGGIPDSFAPSDLRRRFDVFGTIVTTSVHFRERGDNYGFVTYERASDAFSAIEGGNNVPGKKFTLCFGGRRKFCKTDYADLDGCTAVKEEWALHQIAREPPSDNFDDLLRQTLRKLKS